MDLKRLVEQGFYTRELCQGGDEERQDAKFLAARNQAVLLAKLRELYMSVATVDADESLSEVGRAKRKVELAEKTLAAIQADSARLRGLVENKGLTAQRRLAEAGRPAGESDVDRLGRMLAVQNCQRFLADLDGQGLLGELARAVKDGDSTTYEAIVSLPVFILREKSITREMVDVSRQEWNRRLDPSAAGEVESAELMTRVVTEDLGTATKAIREFCNLPEENVVRTL